MDIIKWSIKIRPIILLAAKDGEALYSQQKQDWDLTHIMNSLLRNSDLKKVEKTSRPFRYDLNQIFYDYTVAMTNRFKGLDLIDRMSEELWTEVCMYRRQCPKLSPRKKKWKKAKWLSEEPLQIAEKRRKVKGKGEKERYTIWMQSSRE